MITVCEKMTTKMEKCWWNMRIIKEILSVYPAVHREHCVFVLLDNCKDKLTAQHAVGTEHRVPVSCSRDKAIIVLFPNAKQIIKWINIKYLAQIFPNPLKQNCCQYHYHSKTYSWLSCMKRIFLIPANVVES